MQGGAVACLSVQLQRRRNLPGLTLGKRSCSLTAALGPTDTESATETVRISPPNRALRVTKETKSPLLYPPEKLVHNNRS